MYSYVKRSDHKQPIRDTGNIFFLFIVIQFSVMVKAGLKGSKITSEFIHTEFKQQFRKVQKHESLCLLEAFPSHSHLKNDTATSSWGGHNEVIRGKQLWKNQKAENREGSACRHWSSTVGGNRVQTWLLEDGVTEMALKLEGFLCQASQVSPWWYLGYRVLLWTMDRIGKKDLFPSPTFEGSKIVGAIGKRISHGVQWVWNQVQCFQVVQIDCFHMQEFI